MVRKKKPSEAKLFAKGFAQELKGFARSAKKEGEFLITGKEKKTKTKKKRR